MLSSLSFLKRHKIVQEAEKREIKKCKLSKQHKASNLVDFILIMSLFFLNKDLHR